MGTEFIAELNRELTGRMLDIWRGHDDSLLPLNMGAEAQDRYRDFWRTEAREAHPSNQTPHAVPRPLDVCRHLVEPPLHRSGCGLCPVRWVYPCEVFGRCSPAGYHAGVKRCDGCEHQAPVSAEKPDPVVRRLVLVNEGGPSDVLVLSAAIESVHRAHPGRYVIAVVGAGAEFLAHNTNVVAAEAVIDGRPVAWECLTMPPTQSRRRNGTTLRLVEEHCAVLAGALGVPIPPGPERPCLSLTPDEHTRPARVREFAGHRRYWVVGTEPQSGWSVSDYQRFVDLLSGKELVVQVGDGEALCSAPQLTGVLDLRAGLGFRELARVVACSAGGVAGGRLLRLLCVAFARPHVRVAGGHETPPAARDELPGRNASFGADAGELVTAGGESISPEQAAAAVLAGCL